MIYKSWQEIIKREVFLNILAQKGRHLHFHKNEWRTFS